MRERAISAVLAEGGGTVLGWVLSGTALLKPCHVSHAHHQTFRAKRRDVVVNLCGSGREEVGTSSWRAVLVVALAE